MEYKNAPLPIRGSCLVVIRYQIEWAEWLRFTKYFIVLHDKISRMNVHFSDVEPSFKATIIQTHDPIIRGKIFEKPLLFKCDFRDQLSSLYIILFL